MSVAGGLVMLTGAAAAHHTGSISLAVIGGAWLLMGLVGARQYRRAERRMTFDGISVRFSSSHGDHDVPLADIREFRSSPYDFIRPGPMPMRAVTADDTYLVAPCRGADDFLVALKAANPAIKLPL